MADSDSGTSISVSAKLPYRALLLCIGAALTGGVGVGTLMPQGFEAKGVEICFDNAKNAESSAAAALRLAVSHGAELQQLGARIEALRDRVYEQSSRSKAEAATEAAETDRKHSLIRQEIDSLRKEIGRD
jgi:hypothetical protein